MTRKTMSDIAEQLRAKGFSLHTSQFQIATLKFYNAGGSKDEALAVVEAVFKPIAGSPRRPTTAIDTNPTPTDLSQFSGQSHLRRRRPKMPGHATVHSQQARDAVDTTITKSLFDTYHLPDGRTLGEVRWCDAPALAARFLKTGTMAHRLLMGCYNFGIPADPTATLKVVVPGPVAQAIVDGTDLSDVG